MKKAYENLNPEPHITIHPSVSATLEEAQLIAEFFGEENSEIREVYNIETGEFLGYGVYDKE